VEIGPPPLAVDPDNPGRKPVGDRQALTGILFVLKTGLRWQDLPAEMGCACGMTCWRRLYAWHQAGVWFRLHQLLLQKLDDADRAYDAEPHREELRERQIEPRLAQRGTPRGSGLGTVRRVVERFFSWLPGFRKLRFVTEKDPEMQFASFNLAPALISLRFLGNS
jgi:transposase